MRVLIISSADYPASWDFPGHGLGKLCLFFAENLKKHGHQVTLLAGMNSESHFVKVAEATTEDELRRYALKHQKDFDVIVDASHLHLTSKDENITTPVLSYSPDRESPPYRNAAFPTENHRDFFGMDGVLIPTSFPIMRYQLNLEPEDYFLYFAATFPQKGFKTALHLKQITGLPFVLAGPGTQYLPDGLGPQIGREKYKLLSNAKALVFPSPHEAGPITVLEAQACGTPVICFNKGGAANHILHGITGFAAENQSEMKEALYQVDTLSRRRCREFVEENFSPKCQADAFEEVFARLLQGETW